MGRAQSSSGAPTRAACAWTATHTSRRAPSAAHTSAAHSTGRASPRWQRTSTNPPSRAPTWSSSSAHNCPSTRPADPGALIEQIVDEVGVRISAPREAHHREGSEKFTIDAIIAEEEHILEMVDESDNRARLDVRSQDLDDLSADQQRAIRNIAVSPYLVQPLQAPAGAGKTHSLKALRAAAHRARKEVLVLAPTGKAVDEAMTEGAGDRGLTVAKALNLIEDDRLDVTRSTVVVVDEASMVGTPELKKLLACAAAGRAKIVLVGDAYQLSPVKARGGMFEQLCADLPWSQRLGEVWRMADPEERDTSLALRAAHGNRLRTAIKWYRDNGRLHSGDPIAMAADALDAYLTDRTTGKDALLICDTWEMADALNRRLHDTLGTPGPTLTVARDQPVTVGDIVMSRSNDVTITVHPGPDRQDHDRVDQVRNGNRWRVVALDPDTQSRCRRTAIRQRACDLRQRLCQEPHHAGICGDGAFGPGSDRRQLLRDPRRRRIAGDAVRGDDPRTPQQRSVPIPTLHQRSRSRALQTAVR